MAQSGVKCSKECTAVFEDLKKNKKHKYIVYRLNEKLTEIVVDVLGEPDGTYEELKSYLEKVGEERNCRYAVYDCEFTKGGAAKQKIVFIAWNPENAITKQKMVYTSSKDYLKKALEVTVEVQATDSDELDYTALEEKAKSHTTH